MQDNLPELRDIHLPDGVSAFPIANGWWFTLAGIVLLFLLVQFILYLRRYSKARYALKLLQNISNENVVLAAKEMSEILRRICVLKYKEASVLLGADWIDFLNQKSKTPIYGKTAELLINAPYIPKESSTYSINNLEDLRSFCQKWIGENL